MLLLFLTGVLSLLAQVVVLRELAVASFGVELVSIVALGAWLLGSAMGAAADALAARSWPVRPASLVLERDGGSGRHAPGTTVTTALLAVLGVGVLPVLALVRAGRVMLGGVPGAYLPLDRQLALVALGTLPLAALSGLAFQGSARRLLARGRTLAAAYGIESAGALAAGVAATMALRAGVATFTLACACAWLGVVLAAALVHRRWILVPCAGAVAAVAWHALGPALDARLTRVNHPALLVSRDTPYTRVTVEGDRTQASVFEDDALVFTTGDVEAEVLAHMVLLQHPAPKRVFVLGGSVAGVDGYARLHAANAITVAEVDRQMLDVVMPFVQDVNGVAAAEPVRAAVDESVSAAVDKPVPAAVDAPPLSEEPESTGEAKPPAPAAVDMPLPAAVGRRGLVIGDPRQLLQQAGPIDVVLVAMPEPSSGAANRFYTREFFGRCRGQLAPGGVVGLRLRVSENTWTPVARARIAAIRAAMAAAFPHVQVLPTPTVLVMVASGSPLPPVGIVLARMGERRLTPRLATPQFVRYLYDNDRRAEAERNISAERVPANTDAAPAAFRDAMVEWIGRFRPAVSTWNAARPAGAHRHVLAAGVLAACLVLIAVARRSATARRLGVMVAGGFVGMVLEAVVLLHYQVTSGVLFADLGVLLSGFMSGLAIGACAWARRESAGTAGSVVPSRDRRAPKALLLVCAALAAVVAGFIGAGVALGLMASTLVLGVAGASIGALFGWASAPDAASRATRWTYAADLFGGCLGGIAGGLVLIPFGGLPLSALACAAAALLALALA